MGLETFHQRAKCLRKRVPRSLLFFYLIDEQFMDWIIFALRNYNCGEIRRLVSYLIRTALTGALMSRRQSKCNRRRNWLLLIIRSRTTPALGATEVADPIQCRRLATLDNHTVAANVQQRVIQASLAKARKSGTSTVQRAIPMSAMRCRFFFLFLPVICQN